MVREYTNKLLAKIEKGIADKDTVIGFFCDYMSEDDVKDMMEGAADDYFEVNQDE